MVIVLDAKSASRKKIPKLWGCAFFNSAASRAVSRENAHLYDRSASGELCLDTPRQITDTSGNVVWQRDNTDPFGNNIANENPSGLGTYNFNLGFSGQYWDRETNTYYNYFRDCYDPALGRYCQSDPIGLEGGSWSTYVYVNSNPLSYVDPEGLAPPVRGTYYPRGQIPRPPAMSTREAQQQLLNDIAEALDPYNPNFGKPIPGWPRKPKPVCRMVCPSDTPNSCSADAGKGLPKRDILSGEMCAEICDTNQSMTEWR